MHIIVIADHATCLAFSLDGFTTRPVKGREEALAILESIRHNKEIGLVLITEPVAATIRSEVDEIIYTLHQPLVVEIPDTKGPLTDRPSVGKLMVSLIGR